MKNCFILARKELNILLRDRMTIIIILIPFLIFPILNLGMQYVNRDYKSLTEVVIQCDNTEMASLLTDYIKTTKKIKIYGEINNYNEKEWGELLNNGIVDVAIYIKNLDFNLIYNSSSYNSLSAATKIGESFSDYYYDYLRGNDQPIYKFCIKDEQVDAVSPYKAVSNFITPVLLVMFITQSTSAFANDLFAGEKERGTLEILLLSFKKRREIFFGKILALLIMMLISLVISLISFFTSLLFSESNLTQIKFLSQDNAMINVFVIIVMLTCISLFNIFVSLSVSMISSSMKNSQILNEIFAVLPMGLLVLVLIGTINSESAAVKYIPVLNVIASFYNAFFGKVDIFMITASVGITAVLLIILTKFCIKYIESERIVK